MSTETTGDEKQGELGSLRDLAEGRTLQLPAGQVLFYRGHLAPGVFVVLTGSVAREAHGQEAQVLPAPRVLPLPGELGIRSVATLRIAADAEALFFARSRVTADPGLRSLLLGLADSLEGEPA
jgi:hypothetical protein